ncbi:MAG TPA: TIGR02996 domain-containing protein, partial [Kofleriaceae bacterium]
MTAALLAQIWKKPTDRDLLRVYADWLASNGEPARGEFINLSLLAELSPAQHRRRDALLAKHRGAWLGAARPFVYAWQESVESPGFIASAHCSFAKLTQGFAHIRALGPRLIVRVGEPKAKRETIALAKLPLGTLYGLALYDYQGWMSDDWLMTVAPALAGLRAFALYPFHRPSDRSWATMLPYLRSLEHLEL